MSVEFDRLVSDLVKKLGAIDPSLRAAAEARVWEMVIQTASKHGGADFAERFADRLTVAARTELDAEPSITSPPQFLFQRPTH